ncbi:unnamed protein product, partial [marine sediment metagenome]
MKQEQAISSEETVHSQEQVASKDILRILENHNKDRGGLISILEEIQ